MLETRQSTPDVARAETHLTEAVQEVLETMFFLTIEGGVHEISGSHRCRNVNVAFHGPAEGHMGISVCEALAPALASGFTGRDESELTEAEIDGVLCELANMLCGSLLSRLEGDALFSIAPPAVVDEITSGAGVCRAFDTGIGQIRVCVAFADGGASGGRS